MPMILDDKGNEIADFQMSQKQQQLLESMGEITVFFHTPQLLRATLGSESGSFVLRKQEGDDRVITINADAFRNYVKLQKAIRAARGHV